MSAVSSMTIVALPAPTPYAGLPELYAALTIAGPPVAIVRSQMLISSHAGGYRGPWRGVSAPGCPSRSRRRSSARAGSRLSRCLRPTRLHGRGDRPLPGRDLRSRALLHAIATADPAQSAVRPV